MARTPSSDREAFWQKLIDRHASSHLTVAELCQQAGVSPPSFYIWRKRLKSPSDGTTVQASLVPVRIATDQRGGGEITVEFADTPTPTPEIRVCSPPDCDEASIRRVLCAVVSARRVGPSC